MKLATLKNGTPDGRLVVVSSDAAQAVDATAVAPNLLAALSDWERAMPALRELSDALDAGRSVDAFAFDPAGCAAPLPRSPQWLDGSAFLNHGRLMEQAFNAPPIPDFETIPVMYQGASDDFLGPHDEVPFPTETDGIDFEGEFGVVLGPVPMAPTRAEALSAVRLIVQINDWSLRGPGQREMKTGFGFLHAKPSTAFAPIAVTPDELGGAWHDGRVGMALKIALNGARIGEPNGREMNFGFDRLVQHGAASRRLSAGTIVGSGTVSNVARAAGSACLAERRVIEMIDEGAARTPFMRFGDRVRMEAFFEDGRPGPFGIIDQSVVRMAERSTA